MGANEKEQQMRSQQVARKVLRSFLGEGQSTPYRKGQIVFLEEARATQYDAQNLTVVPSGPPAKAKALAASAAAKASKKTGPSESKESPKKDESGLESWPVAGVTEEAYVGRYDGKDNSPEVAERLKLAKARIKAGVSAGGKG